MKKFVFYLPRALTILIVAFFYLFVLEGFGPDFGWQDSLAHFVLATVVLLISIFAWKKPKVGGWLFIFAGVCFLITSITRGAWWSGLPVIVPLVLIGVLFLVEGFKKE